MKVFFDTEFKEDGTTIRLISIGIVTDDGREYYAESIDAIGFYSFCSDWVKVNVIRKLKHMNGDAQFLRTDDEIRQDIIKLFPPMAEKPEFWAYYADYDWVVFCQLFGTMLELPKWFPMFCLDIKQEAHMKGNPSLPKQDETLEHNALDDARWNKQAYDFLMTKPYA